MQLMCPPPRRTQLPPDCAARVRVCSSGVVPQGPGSTSASGASGASGTAGTSSSVDEEGGAAFDLSALRAAQQVRQIWFDVVIINASC